MLVIEGLTDGEYLKVSYKFDHVISPLYFALIVGGVILVLSTCVGLVILYAVRKLSKMNIDDTKKMVLN